MVAHAVYFWKKSLFIRLLPPFIAGIVLQWRMQLPLHILFLIVVIPLFTLIGFFLLPFFRRYKLSFVNGLFTFILFTCIGAILTYNKDIRHYKQWFEHEYSDSSSLLVTLDEPLAEKTKSFKAVATISHIINKDKIIPVKGRVIIYFTKDSLPVVPGYGTQLIFKKSLQEIKNTGNPGAFDYKRYCLFQDITHQVYLGSHDFGLLTTKNENRLTAFIFLVKEKILSILRTHIKKEKELGLAEALLVGYKDDLDKSLVQSYSNTGVVHIIAISGLHLGLIYWILVILFQPLKKRKKLKWLSPLLIISGLWMFSLLAGAQPSVLRSALMFSCIAAGEGFGRKTNIYNSLALSAFLLLCYNPFWLWDVGFQLSYAAVLSIVLFMQPIYNLFYFKNKIVDAIWKLNAVTLAAQILTIPFCIYYFRQFPNYFLITNLVAVPLSSIVLIGEIILCLVSLLPSLGLFIGKILLWLISVMNAFIEKTEAMPFSVWKGLYITMPQLLLLLIFISGGSYWLLERSVTGLKIGLVSLLGFIVIRSLSFIQADNQQKIIIYNIPQKSGIDFIDGRHYFFAGDSLLQQDDPARNFHLNPSRIMHRSNSLISAPILNKVDNYISWHHKRILFLDKPVYYRPGAGKQIIDLLILSKNPKLYILKLAESLDIKQVVFDASVPVWKAAYWKKDCEQLHIPWHDVTVKGAFAMNLP
ncbi:MAG: ComEC/Rec2 family competence protein [Chitinophagaceae bacterium]